MTVCIAAMYKDDNGERGIVTVSDWQITDTHTSFKSRGQKFATLTPYISIMGAGDMTYFGDVVDRVNRKLDGQAETVEEVADAYWEAEVDWQNEYRERHVLSTYNLTWQSYFQKLENNQLPEAFFSKVNEDLRSLPMPCSADAIISGINAPQSSSARPRIIKIVNGIRDSMGREGYAIIGEGDSVALAEFGYANYDRFWNKAKALLLCYIAKKRSEVIASVGETSLVTTINAEQGAKSLPLNWKTQLDKVWNDLKSSRKEGEKKAYEEAKAIIKEYDGEQKGKGAQG